jgi:transposase
MIRLTDEHWERIRDRFPEEHIPDGRPGRKPVPTRRVLEAVLWILNTGAQWHMLPQSYPNYKTMLDLFISCGREHYSSPNRTHFPTANAFDGCRSAVPSLVRRKLSLDYSTRTALEWRYLAQVLAS